MCYNYNIMTYTEKINYVKNFILSGLSMEEAFLHASLSDDEMTQARNDQNLKDEIEFILRQEQMRLFELFRDTVEVSAKQKLDWKGLQTLLEMSFPEKYNKKNKSGDGEDAGSKVTIVLPENFRDTDVN